MSNVNVNEVELMENAEASDKLLDKVGYVRMTVEVDKEDK